MVPTVVEENATDTEVAQQGVFGVLLFTVRSVGKVQIILGEMARIITCVRLPPPPEWICTSSADSIRGGWS